MDGFFRPLLVAFVAAFVARQSYSAYSCGLCSEYAIVSYLDTYLNCSVDSLIHFFDE